ncbi:AAA family ATPase [Halorarum halobium]|uniref:AAA family ATPase n=1 Tax=Halorarum halobium TaxID=3075121 RepID=UPI0028B1BF23|nr:AAA family ATPase [Halobaculum sp. XH14]
MNLHKLIVKNYRSIQGEESGEAIVFKGVDCLVGKNNAGKTNILSAVQFLLNNPEKELDEELYWNRETNREVAVKGFFRFDKSELNRADEGAQTDLEPFLSEVDEDTVEIGVCQIVPPGMDHPNPDAKLVKSVPVEGEMAFDSFESDHSQWWENATSDDHDDTKTDYRNHLRQDYSLVEEYVDEAKLKQKDSWFKGYLKCVDENNIDADHDAVPLDIPSGVETPLFEQLLPRTINIPAVREVESATQRSGELGQLQQALSEAIQDTLDNEVQEQLETLRGRLTPDGSQDRFNAISIIEENITQHLQETFTDRKASLTFPDFTSEYVLRDMQLEIDETDLEGLSMRNVGEGVKRTLIFSLLRTLADLREETLGLRTGPEESLEGETTQRPLLILYEEADLFLHPQLQTTLVSAFNQLVDNNAQVIFSTHSPVMVRYDTGGDSERSADTINVVRKENTTTVSQFHRALETIGHQGTERLTRLHRISSYIFADTVLLVEGDTDQIILEKIAPHFDSQWDFNSHDIPVLEVSGKDYVPIFEKVLSELGISAYSVLDRDAIPKTVQEFPLSGRSQTKLDELEQTADECVADEDVSDGFDYSTIEERFKHMKSEAVENLKSLHSALEQGQEPEEDGIGSLETLIAREESRGDDSSQPLVNQKMILGHPDVQEKRTQLVRTLIEDNNALVLEGTIEDYYPDSGHSTQKAMEFTPGDYSQEELRENFTTFSEGDTTDLELFLSRIFDVGEV